MNGERATGKRGADSLAHAKHRFSHGFVQLFIAFQAVHGDRFAWKRYLRVCLLQSLVIVAATGVFLSTARKSSEELREERVRKALQQVQAVEPGTARTAPSAVRPGSPPAIPPPPSRGTRGATPVLPEPAKPPQPPKPPAPVVTAPSAKPAPEPGDEADTEDEEEEEETETGDATDDQPPASAATPAPRASRGAKAPETGADIREQVSDLQAAITDLASQAGETAVRRSKEFQESRGELDKQFNVLERAARKAPLSDEDRAALVRLGAELDVLEQRTRPGWWDSALALILSIYGTLSLIQAAVIALSRDYHVSIARDASLLLGVAPEDPPLVPRIRVNIGWIRRKLKQRTRTLFVFIPGLAVISIAVAPFPHRATVSSVLTALWAAYWWVVWTASKSARAWEREAQARPPWFLRLWHRLATVPFLGWIARSSEAIWVRVTRPVFSPAEAVEEQPLEFAGLAAARALQLIPVLKLFVRPLVPVAAARLLAERVPRAELLLGAADWESLSAQRAAMPASPEAIRARDVM